MIDWSKIMEKITGFLGLLVLCLTAGPTHAGDKALAQQEATAFRIEKIYYTDQAPRAGADVAGLKASLDRARKAGVTGVGAKFYRMSLEQAVWHATWRRDVSSHLELLLR